MLLNYHPQVALIKFSCVVLLMERSLFQPSIGHHISKDISTAFHAYHPSTIFTSHLTTLESFKSRNMHTAIHNQFDSVSLVLPFQKIVNHRESVRLVCQERERNTFSPTSAGLSLTNAKILLPQTHQDLLRADNSELPAAA